MFAARGIAVSSTVFFLVYVALSVTVSCLWRRISTSIHVKKLSARHCADLLLALRILPFATATVITTAFTVPSFLLFEPRTIQEPLGGLPLALGLCGIGLAMFGAANAVAAMIRASRIIAQWMSKANAIQSPLSVPLLRIDRFAPALVAAGILRPRVLLSAAAQSVLSDNELRTALQHEVAHVSRRDNLKKLFLSFVAFPGMKNLETAWLEYTEMAADHAAVSSVGEALDLAAALIKLSKINSTREPRTGDISRELMTAFVHGSAALIGARVERLIHWRDEHSNPGEKSSRRSGAEAALAMAITMTVTVAITYSHLLAQVHTATEWLVR
jgi:Zn-dependent protease with chaperone function